NKANARLGQGPLDSKAGNRVVFQNAKSTTEMAIASVDMDEWGFVDGSLRIEADGIPTISALL
ncbi:unnamed protein product, partial [marine sediment metagenome]